MSTLRAVFVIVPIAVLFCASNAIAEKTNQKDVRKSLSKDGWQVAYGTMFTEGDWLEAAGSVVASYYSANPAPIEEWVRSEVDRNYAKIAPQVENLALADLKNMCIKSIRDGKLYQIKNLQVEVSIATYKRWEEWKHPSLDLKTGKYRNVTEKTKYPNWHQLYLRYRVVPNGNQGSPKPIIGRVFTTQGGETYSLIGPNQWGCQIRNDRNQYRFAETARNGNFVELRCDTKNHNHVRITHDHVEYLQPQDDGHPNLLVWRRLGNSNGAWQN